MKYTCHLEFSSPNFYSLTAGSLIVVSFAWYKYFGPLSLKSCMHRIIIAMTITLFLISCKSATEITGSWKNTNKATGDINFILVTALTERVNVRQMVENELSTALEKKGCKTIKSIDVLPPTFAEGEKPDKIELFSKINQTGANAILTVALIDKENETRYIPGNNNYAPLPRYGYYGTFWGYYNTWFPSLYSPGYYVEDKVYFIETNLYDAKTEELLWSAQSETYNPSTLAAFSKDFANVVVTKMKNDGVLKVYTPSPLAKERGNKN
jgi:hypothetical protein